MPETVVHVVDDDPSMRAALVRLLRAAGYEARAYSSAGDFLMAARPDAPGCILLDVRMPGPNGLDLHSALARERNPLPVIFLTGYGDVRTSVRAMKAGAVDFLTKPVKRENLMGAISNALTLDAERRRIGDYMKSLRDRYERLTAREREVFGLVAKGLLNKQIAAELGTSERTIKAHRAQVMDKMEAASFAELVRAADQLKI